MTLELTSPAFTHEGRSKLFTRATAKTAPVEQGSGMVMTRLRHRAAGSGEGTGTGIVDLGRVESSGDLRSAGHEHLSVVEQIGGMENARIRHRSAEDKVRFAWGYWRRRYTTLTGIASSGRQRHDGAQDGHLID